MRLHIPIAILALGIFGWAQVATAPPNPTGPPPATVPVPAGATSWDYKTYDKDPWFNPDDLLEAESGLPLENPEPGGHVQVTWDDLTCEDGTVRGPEGDSGEGTADVYVIVTFHFPSGASSVTQTKVQKISCEDV